MGKHSSLLFIYFDLNTCKDRTVEIAKLFWERNIKLEHLSYESLTFGSYAKSFIFRVEHIECSLLADTHRKAENTLILAWDKRSSLLIRQPLAAERFIRLVPLPDLR
jgi:hypothetical protein